MIRYGAGVSAVVFYAHCVRWKKTLDWNCCFPYSLATRRICRYRVGLGLVASFAWLQFRLQITKIEKKNIKMQCYKITFFVKFSCFPFKRVRTTNRRHYMSYVVRSTLGFFFVWQTTIVLFTDIRVDGLLIGTSRRRVSGAFKGRHWRLQ